MREYNKACIYIFGSSIFATSILSGTTSDTEFGLLHRFRTSLIASLDLFISDAESDIEMELWDVHLNENRNDEQTNLHNL